METGKIIRKLRKANDLTHKALGELIGVTPSAISSYENSGIMPPFEKLEMLADVFKITVKDFYGDGTFEVENEVIEKENSKTIDFLKSQIILLMEEKSKLINLLDKALSTGNGNFQGGNDQAVRNIDIPFIILPNLAA